MYALPLLTLAPLVAVVWAKGLDLNTARRIPGFARRWALLAILTLAVSGCGTFNDALGGHTDSGSAPSSQTFRIYGGVRWDVEIMEDEAWGWLFLLDLPFSFALDTALLPLTVLYAIVAD